jgi:nicotinate phosphoribosyltransferase
MTGATGLLTDLYQLTMAAGYWKSELAEREAVFHLFFRRSPFGGGYAIACGLEAALSLLQNWRFDPDDLQYLSTLEGGDGRPLFESAFLDYLGDLRLTADLDAVPEGTAIFAHEPLLRFTGPLIQGQILETSLLTVLNFQTLIATKAARVCRAAEGDPVLEFGLRRAQGVDGGLSASRAAYVGGCVATSNVMAGKRWDIPVKGTHAHSWVMAFDSEEESFAAYARAMPNNCTFLVDTYDTQEGIGHAIHVAEELRQCGHEMAGIRLDSGNLATLSRKARALLDAAGFKEASIVASSDLDEHRIARLKASGAEIGVWGVGTRLATAFDQPALGGVFKLAALRDAAGVWQPKIKLSEDRVKVSTPGLQQVRRYRHQGRFVGDVIYNSLDGPPESVVDAVGQPMDYPADAQGEDLLVPVLRKGSFVDPQPSTETARGRTLEQLARLPEAVLRLKSPEAYPVGFDNRLYGLKQRLITAAQGAAEVGRTDP